MSNPIKYSDLIIPDDSIDNLIGKLNALGGEYQKLSSGIKSEAQGLASSLKNVTGATEEQQAKIREAATSADLLSKKQKQVEASVEANAKEIAGLNNVLQQNNRLNKLQAQANQATEGSIVKLRAEYKLLLETYEGLSEEARENTEEGRRMQAQLLEMSEKLQAFNATTGKSGSQLGGMRKAMNGLSGAASQIVRELPVLTMSADQFFLAISNNLPIYFDQLQRVREENQKLIAQGKPAQNTLMAVMKSFVSWQSLLVIGITLLTKYGGRILDFVGKLLRGEKAFNATAEAAKNFNNIIQESEVSSAKEIAQIQLMTQVAEDNTASMEARNKAAEWLLEHASDYLYLYDAEAVKAGEAKTAIDQLIESKKEEARVRALVDAYISNVEKQVKIQQELETAVAKTSTGYRKWALAINTAFKNMSGLGPGIASVVSGWISGTGAIEKYKNELSVLAETQEKIYNDINASLSNWIENNNSTLTSSVDYQRQLEDARIDLMEEGETKEIKIAETAIRRRIEDLQKEHDTNVKLTNNQKETILKIIEVLEEELGQTTAEIRKKYADQALKEAKEFENNINNAVIDSMEEGEEREIAQSNAAFDAKIQIWQDELKTRKNLTEEQEAEINAIIEEYQERRAESEENIRKKYNERRLSETTKFANSLTDAEIDAMEEGEEKEVARSKAAFQKKIDQWKQELASRTDVKSEEYKRIQSLITDYENRMEEAEATIRKKWADQRTNDVLDAEEKLADATYELEMLKIDASDDIEKEKTRRRLIAEKNRLETILSLYERTLPNLSGAEREEMMRNIALIKAAIAATSADLGRIAMDRDIYDVLGIKLDDEQKEAIEEALSHTKDSIGEIIDSYEKLADAAVDAADAQVSAAQSALEAETEARNNGYANNVQQAQKELALAQKTQQKALADQRKAQRAQEALASIEQAVDLTTASAKIWGQLGFPWAIAAIAAMWGSFAWAKVKARQVTQTATYGDGLVEYLDYGGSHSSGNDIDFGVMKDGTRRRVEKGEIIGVINKRNVNKYGKDKVSNILSSLNSGTFEERYGTAFAGIEYGYRQEIDLSRIEKGIDTIVSSNQRKVIVSNGRTIEYYKNTKRITRE